jgi:ribonuclease HII
VVVAVFLTSRQTKSLAEELKATLSLRRLADSKRLTPRNRQKIFTFLERRIAWAVGEVQAVEIDQLRLRAAVSLAAERALNSLRHPNLIIPEILADAGLHHPFELEIPTTSIIRGDESVLAIMLASIMAKVWRDRLMKDLSQVYPQYGFSQHMGYATSFHRQQIQKYGLTPEHRRSFLGKMLDKE